MDCLIPEISYTPIGPTSTHLYSSFDADECCEDVIAKCYCQEGYAFLKEVGFAWMIIYEDKIQLNRPAPPIEWRDEVEVWFGIVRLSQFTLQEWYSFQGRARRILENDDSDGHLHAPLPHIFFTSTATRTSVSQSVFGPFGAQALLNQVDYILSYKERLSSKEYKLLKDLSAALGNVGNPPVELRCKQRLWGV